MEDQFIKLELTVEQAQYLKALLDRISADRAWETGPRVVADEHNKTISAKVSNALSKGRWE